MVFIGTAAGLEHRVLDGAPIAMAMAPAHYFHTRPISGNWGVWRQLWRYLRNPSFPQ
jgi:hypothetical protein